MLFYQRVFSLGPLFCWAAKESTFSNSQLHFKLKTLSVKKFSDIKHLIEVNKLLSIFLDSRKNIDWSSNLKSKTKIFQFARHT